MVNEIFELTEPKKKKKGNKRPKRMVSVDIASGLPTLVNEGVIKKCKFKLKKYQRVEVSLYDRVVLEQLLEACEFKDKGTVYDYDKYLPKPESISSYSVGKSFNLMHRIAISKKYKAIMYYNVEYWYIRCTIVVSLKHLEELLEMINKFTLEDTGANMFRDTNFECNDGQYIEVVNVENDNTKDTDVIQKKLPDENLVFDKKSTITEVMKDIKGFFKKETYDLYRDLDLPYKRGIILYGDPGNGKSAMIRQLIRSVHDVSKIIINPGIRNVTYILSSLMKALDGKKAIIIIEDIDSLINDRNRSEFLNILDGVDIKSGVLFIGTTNYPERLDPAIMNRAGRFDRTYKIDNPTKDTRKAYFKSRKLEKIFNKYKLDKKNKGTINDVVDLLTEYSDNLPMASLKEIVTSVAYKLVSSEYPITIKEAVMEVSSTLNNSRNSHQAAHNNFERMQMMNIGNNIPIPRNLIYDDHVEEVPKKKSKKKNKKKTSIKKEEPRTVLHLRKKKKD